MSQRLNEEVSLRRKIEREWNWLKEDIVELRDRIPRKYFDMAGFMVVFMGYFFIFDEYARKRPELTILMCAAGSWFGVEVAIQIAKLVKRK